MIKKLAVTICLSLLLGEAVYADDTDIYVTPRVDPGSRPLVMLNLDFRQNLSGPGCKGSDCDTLISDGYLSGKPSGSYTKFDVLRAILTKVMSRLSGVEVGLMMNHDDSGACAVPGPSGPTQAGCSTGGFIPVGFGDVGNATHLNRLLGTLNGLPTPTNNNTAHATQPVETQFEFYRYLTGQAPVSAHNSGADKTATATSPIVTSDPSIQSAGNGNYISPIISACRSTYSINFTYTQFNQDAEADYLIRQSISAGGMGFDPDTEAKMFAFLYDNDLADGTFGNLPDFVGTQNVVSYFFVSKNGLTAGDILAAAGGSGSAFSLDASPDELVQTLSDIFEDIISTSATFVSASLPINSFNRSELVDHAYLALFKSNSEGKPTWTGNVKKLKISGQGDSLFLTDALGQQAVSTDGRIKNSTLTFWTDPATLPTADPELGQIENRDGRSVTRGGAGQRIPGFVSGSPGLVNGAGNRQLYFDNSAFLKPLSADSTTASTLQSDLGAATVLEASELIAFARGLDIDDIDEDGVINEARPWIISDPLHSKPVIINYGTRYGHSVDNPLLYIGAGTNDGFFHFIRSTNADGSESGAEEWAFMPRSVMGILPTLRSDLAVNRHPYGVDGAPVAFVDDTNRNGTIETGESAYLVFGLRRGGSNYYALDVSDPLVPKLKWVLGASGDFAELGLTFSTPRIGHVNYGSGTKPVVIFGGGYDTNKDAYSIGTNDSRGNALYVVDLESGALIWKAVQGNNGGITGKFQHPNLTNSIPSAITTIDTDGDGLIDRLVVGDTGGNVWRADLYGSDTANWSLTLIATLGRHDPSALGRIDDRRFFHRPDFIQSRDDNGPFDAIVIGSGNRANPLDKGGSTANYLYMLKDRNIAVGSPGSQVIKPSNLGDISDNCLQNDSCFANPNLSNGWRMYLDGGEEKMLSTPVTISGTIYATSYLPAQDAGDPNVCAISEGTGRLYAIALQDGTATRQDDPAYNPGYDPENPGTDGRSTLLDSPGIPPEVVAVAPDKILRPDLLIEDGVSRTRWKTFWYVREDLDL